MPDSIQTCWWLNRYEEYLSAYADDVINDEENKSIFDLFSKFKFKNEDYNCDLLRNEPETAWLFEKITRITSYLNNRFFQYDIAYIENLQLHKVDKESSIVKLDRHSHFCHVDNGTVKLSFYLFLSAPEDYSGGNLECYPGPDPVTFSQNKLRLIMIPGFLLRRITPTIAGTNYILMGNLIGPQFK